MFHIQNNNSKRLFLRCNSSLNGFIRLAREPILKNNFSTRLLSRNTAAAFNSKPFPIDSHNNSSIFSKHYCGLKLFDKHLSCFENSKLTHRQFSTETDKSTQTSKSIVYSTNILGSCSGCGAALQSDHPLEPGYISTKPQPIVESSKGKNLSFEEIEFIKQISKDAEKEKDDKNDENIDIEELKEEISPPIMKKADPDSLNFDSDIELPKSVARNLGESITTTQRDRVCKRCHSLKNYGQVVAVQVPLASDVVNELLLPLKTQQVFIIKVVDVFDIGGTIVDKFYRYIGPDNKVVLVVNKVDLLPKDVVLSRVRAWIKRFIKVKHPKLFPRLVGIQLISAKTGHGIKEALYKIDELNSSNRDLFVIGSTNVGKSTFVNKVVRLSGKSSPNITVSRAHGTTLSNIYLSYPRKPGTNIVDTPGLASDRVAAANIGVEPKKSVRATTVRLKRGKSVFFGGLGRLDYLDGEPQAIYATVFAAAQVKLHVTNTDTADDLHEKHCGTLLTPPYINKNKDNADKLKVQLHSREFELDGKRWKDAICDVVLPGVGWVAINALGKFKMQAWSVVGSETYLREPLMPFEMRQHVKTFKMK